MKSSQVKLCDEKIDNFLVNLYSPNLLIRGQMLYPLSYKSLVSRFSQGQQVFIPSGQHLSIPMPQSNSWSQKLCPFG
jgi:hypothetical protein